MCVQWECSVKSVRRRSGISGSWSSTSAFTLKFGSCFCVRETDASVPTPPPSTCRATSCPSTSSSERSAAPSPAAPKLSPWRYLFIYICNIIYIYTVAIFYLKKKKFQDCDGGKKKKSHHDTWEIFCETRYASVITRNKTAWITFSLSKCLVVVVVCCWHAEMKTLCLLLVTAALILLLILLLITYKLLLVRTEYFSQLLL